MEGVKAKPAGMRKTKQVMVKQEYIDLLLMQRKARPRRPFPAYAVEGINRLYRDQSEERERLLSIWAEAAAVMKTMHDKEEDILEQFRNKGYAMEEIEIRDDDDEDEN